MQLNYRFLHCQSTWWETYPTMMYNVIKYEFKHSQYCYYCSLDINKIQYLKSIDYDTRFISNNSYYNVMIVTAEGGLDVNCIFHRN